MMLLVYTLLTVEVLLVHGLDYKRKKV